MATRSALTLRIAPLFGSVAFAQDVYKIEATVDCSYVHANPQNNTMNPGED